MHTSFLVPLGSTLLLISINEGTVQKGSYGKVLFWRMLPLSACSTCPPTEKCSSLTPRREEAFDQLLHFSMHSETIRSETLLLMRYFILKFICISS